MAEPVNLPVLWHFRVSHYNEKVRWALDFKQWPHLRRALIPGLHVLRARWLSGQNAVPILKLDGRILHDSTRIIARLERLRPHPPLYPADPTSLKRALALEDYFDEEVAPVLRRLFWATYLHDSAACARLCTDGFGRFTRIFWRLVAPVFKPAFRKAMRVTPVEVARAHKKIPEIFARLEEEIGPRGYLVGDQFTIADLTAAAVMTALVRPSQFSYALPEPRPRPFLELQESLRSRPGFQWVCDIYARHRGPSFEVTAP